MTNADVRAQVTGYLPCGRATRKAPSSEGAAAFSRIDRDLLRRCSTSEGRWAQAKARAANRPGGARQDGIDVEPPNTWRGSCRKPAGPRQRRPEQQWQRRQRWPQPKRKLSRRRLPSKRPKSTWILRASLHIIEAIAGRLSSSRRLGHPSSGAVPRCPPVTPSRFILR